MYCLYDDCKHRPECDRIGPLCEPKPVITFTVKYNDKTLNVTGDDGYLQVTKIMPVPSLDHIKDIIEDEFARLRRRTSRPD